MNGIKLKICMGIGEIILTRKTLNTLRKNCPSITLTTGNQIWNNPKPNPGLCVEILIPEIKKKKVFSVLKNVLIY